MIKKIVSGGQTGVDRAALDVALALAIPCGGWCPNGRRALDEPIPEKYPLTETKAKSYNIRTRWNVRDSDATIVINQGPLSGGTAYTVNLAKKQGKPYLIIDLDCPPTSSEIFTWIQQQNICILNIAGPSEKKRPGIHDRTVKFFRGILVAEFLNAL